MSDTKQYVVTVPQGFDLQNMLDRVWDEPDTLSKVERVWLGEVGYVLENSEEDVLTAVKGT